MQELRRASHRSILGRRLALLLRNLSSKQSRQSGLLASDPDFSECAAGKIPTIYTKYNMIKPISFKQYNYIYIEPNNYPLSFCFKSSRLFVVCGRSTLSVADPATSRPSGYDALAPQGHDHPGDVPSIRDACGPKRHRYASFVLWKSFN